MDSLDFSIRIVYTLHSRQYLKILLNLACCTASHTNNPAPASVAASRYSVHARLWLYVRMPSKLICFGYRIYSVYSVAACTAVLSSRPSKVGPTAWTAVLSWVRGAMHTGAHSRPRPPKHWGPTGSHWTPTDTPFLAWGGPCWQRPNVTSGSHEPGVSQRCFMS